MVLLAHALVLTAWRWDSLSRPWLGGVLAVTMTVWTGVALWGYAVPRRRVPLLLVADLGVALALLALTPLAKGETFNATVPGFWIAGPLLAWAIHWRWLGGLVAALLLCTVDLLIRDHVEQRNVANVFLLLIAGPMVGYLCASLVSMARERDVALREAAAAGERARLARAVHDGVLQVLALMQRRGLSEPALASLGRLAGEQEAALRALIRAQDTTSSPSGPVDLAARLLQWESRSSPRTTVAAPSEPVLLPAPVVDEIDAVVAECLSNVRHHVGPDARAWVLVEDGPSVVVSVRDEGPGIPPGRLDQAVAAGRLGVSSSIRGRMHDLGGTVTLDTGPEGTEWELTLPRSTRH